MIPFLDLKAVYAELKPELDAAYRRVMESGWFVLGREVEAFEAEYAAFYGTAHCCRRYTTAHYIRLPDAAGQHGAAPSDPECCARRMWF